MKFEEYFKGGGGGQNDFKGGECPPPLNEPLLYLPILMMLY